MISRRILVLAPANLMLLLGMWAGLQRMGWGLPTPTPALPASHGPLMVSGFLGALISLERVVALRLSWGYLAPLLAVTGSALLIGGGPTVAAALLIFAGSVLLALLASVMVRRHPALHTWVMAFGVFLWVGGNALWMAGRPLYLAVPWWMNFLVLTIAGERLELSRVLRFNRLQRYLFAAIVATILSGVCLSSMSYGPGMRLMGAGLFLLSLWLLRYDIARRTVRRSGLTRYIAVCLLVGYFWLAVGGLTALSFGGVTAGLQYDAMLHAVLIGFVFSMIFGHAPIIFPAVLERPIRYSPSFYLPLVLLQVSLLLRIVGDIWLWLPGRRWGGLLNVVALLLFLANTVFSLRRLPESASTAQPTA